FARFDVQIEIKNDLPRAVLEIDAAKFNLAAEAIDRHGRRRLGDTGAAIENLENAASAVRGAGGRGKQLAHRIEPRVKPADKREEHRQRTDRDLSLRDPPRAVAP